MSGPAPLTAEDVIRCLELRPLPVEGGYYRETFRSAHALAPAALPFGYDGTRWLSTAIYYLLTPETSSLFHRLRGAEVYHFYLGDPVELFVLDDASERRIVLGSDILNDMHVQMVVPGGAWQGLRLVSGGAFALLGTTMAPGFDFSDFELGSRADLVERHPSFKAAIERLTAS